MVRFVDVLRRQSILSSLVVRQLAMLGFDQQSNLVDILDATMATLIIAEGEILNYITCDDRGNHKMPAS